MQTLQNEKVSTYDQVPYESYSFAQSQPDRLATLAKLFGVDTPEVKTARVLELGCASGGNLIPLAISYPDAKFVGVDLSKRQVSDAHSLVEKFNLKNVEFKQIDLMDIDKNFGTFDYIIAHGLYSWVAKGVQEKILEICEQNLSPEGVAYISYNTYPGWHYRGMIRDMMLYHTGQFSEPGQKALQARALLDFLSKSVPQEDAYGKMLKSELDLLSQQRDAYLLHDHLEDENEPIYFHQFAEQAAKHNLQYLSEAEFSTMLTTNFAPQIGDTLRRISNDIVRTEQYMDFVRNRAFRQTLLCHQGKQLNRNLDWTNVKKFRFASPARTTAKPENLMNNQPTEFVLPNGVKMTIGNALIKIAFDHLSQIWPRSASFDELLSASLSRLASTVIQDGSSRQMQEQLLGADLLTAYAAGVVVFRTEEPNFVTELSDKPKVTALAQHQAKNGQRITTQLHDSIDADVFVRNVIILLDGTRDMKEIVKELEKLTKKGELNVHKDGKQLTEGAELRETLKTVTEQSLANIAKSALLIG